MAKVKTNTKITAKRPRTGIASSGKRGLRGIDLPQAEIARQTASVIPFLIKTVVIVGIAAFIIYKYQNRFEKQKLRSDLDPSNISDSQAEVRANAIYGSISLFSNDFNAVADNIAGLNYNGFIKLYNAFGKRTGTLLGGELDLVEWIKNQFTDYEVSQLRALLGGAFFKKKKTIMTTEQKYLIGGIAVLATAYFLLVKKETGNGVDPTGNGATDPGDIRVFNAGTVATDLHEAMREMGTDEESIISILTPVTQPQFGQVVAKFGKRAYNKFTGNDYAIIGTTLSTYSLKEWLKFELSSSEYANWKRKYPNYL